MPIGFDEILEPDVGQVELDAKLALEFGAGESDFGTGAKNQILGSLPRFGFQISEKRDWPEPDRIVVDGSVVGGRKTIVI